MKNFYQSRKCQNLAVVNMRLQKLAKKSGTLENVLTNFGVYTKKSPQNSTHFMKTFWNQSYGWFQKRNYFFLFFIRYHFQLEKYIFWGFCARFLGFRIECTPYTVHWLNVCDKEHLALRNNFRVTKKFLITKFVLFSSNLKNC